MFNLKNTNNFIRNGVNIFGQFSRNMKKENKEWPNMVRAQSIK